MNSSGCRRSSGAIIGTFPLIVETTVTRTKALKRFDQHEKVTVARKEHDPVDVLGNRHRAVVQPWNMVVLAT
jgi:hypothetical protein